MPILQATKHLAGESLIERLPLELLSKVLLAVSSSFESVMDETISQQVPIHLNSKAKTASCLLPSLMTSKTIFWASYPLMYRHIHSSQPLTLIEVMARIKSATKLGRAVRSLNLNLRSQIAHCSESGNPLLDLLDETPLVREILISKYMSEYLNTKTIQKLFFELPLIQTLDLSGCDSLAFAQACSLAFEGSQNVTQTITSLNLAKCTALPSSFFENLLAQLPRLQHLNVSATQIESDAISALPKTAKLSHLDISHCTSIDGFKLAAFFVSHPSTKSIIYLNLESSSRTELSLLSESQISRILKSLTPRLRTLNLKGLAINSEHLNLLCSFSKHLTSLSLGRNLRFSEVEQLFFDTRDIVHEEAEPSLDEDSTRHLSKQSVIMDPISDAVAICKLRQRIASSAQKSTKSSLKYLDLSCLSVREQSQIRSSILLGPQSGLEIIEIGEDLGGGVRCLRKLCGAVGWEVGGTGRRAWVKRRRTGGA